MTILSDSKALIKGPWARTWKNFPGYESSSLHRESNQHIGHDATHHGACAGSGCGRGGDECPPNVAVDDWPDDEDDGQGDSQRGDCPVGNDPGYSSRVPALLARVIAAIPAYWAAKATFDAIPPEVFSRDSSGDAAACSMIDRAHRAKRHATAELIASIRAYSAAMDVAHAGQGGAYGVFGGRLAEWPMFVDAENGWLYLVDDGPGGEMSCDGVTVVRLSGWAVRMVGAMVGPAGKGGAA